MEIKIPIGLSGTFKNIEVLGADGKVKRETGEFPNLILDTGLQRLAGGSASGTAYSGLSVGSGNTPPAPTDLNLESFVARTTNVTGTSHGSDLVGGYCWVRITWTFEIGEVVGNISEISTNWGSGVGQMFSRALVTDSYGNPTSITVLSDEQLRVTWEHRRYWPTDDVVGTLINEGNRGGSYDYVLRASSVSDWTVGSGTFAQISMISSVSTNTNIANTIYDGSSQIGPITGTPTGTPKSGSGVTGSNGFVGVNSVGLTLSAGLSGGNLDGGIGCIRFMSYVGSGSGTRSRHIFQVQFTPPIPKTPEDLFEVDLRISWGRV